LWQQASDFPGWNLDQNQPLLFRAADGRTFPGTSRGRRTALFMTNDQGTYDIDPAAPATSQLRAIETAGQREQLLSLYRENRKTLRRGRLDIPRSVPPLSGHNLQLTNAAGSTLFMPIAT
jgi:hypothetical protein